MGQVIDYTQNDVAQAALESKFAPYTVIYDCVGGTEVVYQMDKLLVNDPRRPALGVYVTIVGDSKPSIA